MRRLLFFIAFLLVAVLGHVAWLWSMRPSEVYPDDISLTAAEAGRAMVIVAHDDDAISCAGTILGMVQAGWKVDFLCFNVPPTSRHHGDEVEPRKQEMREVQKVEGLDHLFLVDYTLRRGFEELDEPWKPIAWNEYPDAFEEVRIDSIIRAALEASKPKVVFTLDHQVGGYGHPEHIEVSKAVHRVVSAQKELGVNSVQLIYEPVFAPSMAERMLGDMPPYVLAKGFCACEGMPVPDVQVDISDQGGRKKEVMLAHASQHRNIKKFWPAYNYYPGGLYFGIFDKEYFYVEDLRRR